METDFKVKSGEFEGPLDLLLDLVEKRKLHISDVSLAQVADNFIEHTKSFENFPITDSADFILIASTLLLIKSKSILPNLTLTEEEEAGIENLEERLSVYKKFKDLAQNISRMIGRPIYFAEEKKNYKKIFAPTPEITLSNLQKALLLALEDIPKTEKLDRVRVAKILSLEEMIGRLSKRVEEGIKISFKSFAKIEETPKIEVIVSFLAMLELIKRGVVRVNQNKHFEDIEMEAEKLTVPKYQ